MKTYGDKDFAHALQKTTQKDLRSICQYFEVGIDANDSYKDEMKKEYPISSDALQIK